MSFPLIVYRNLSATNVVDKELQQLEVLDCNLRPGASLIDPVLLVQASNPGFHKNQANYFYVEEFGGRYYYITNIISTNTTLWEIHGHVDVLMSYSDVIKEQRAVVARQEGKYNMMLDDGFFMAYQNPKLQTKVFSNPTPFETQEFVLVVAGS